VPDVNAIRIRDLLLVALTLSTGAVDAISWFGLDKVFSAFMTGNMVFVGFRAASADGPSVPRVLAALVAFAVGAAIAARIVGRTRAPGSTSPRGVTLTLGLALIAQAAFLALWIGVHAGPSSRAGDVLVGLSSLAMGMQTAAVFSLGVRAVFTTAATATLAVLAGDVSTWSTSSTERRRLASVLVALFAGAVIGTLLFDHARRAAPAFPLAMSAVVVLAAELAWGRRTIEPAARLAQGAKKAA
jgi:uncharacterized membrane protein YoaK (UPF0700 family)